MEMRQRAQMTLTPRLQQSVKLLQLSALEFAQELRQALASNPFLEETEDEEETEAAGSLAGKEPDAAAEPADVPEPRGDEDPLSGAADLQGDNHAESGTSKDRDDGETDWTEWTPSTPSLSDHLQAQLRLCKLSDRDRLLCQLLIEALDDDGYLRQSFSELEPLLELTAPVEDAAWNAALKLVQSFEPAGVGARDLGECLLCQLPAPTDCNDEQALARRIVTEHLPLLAKRDIVRLERALGVDGARVRSACQLIRRLDPHPGWRFGESDIRYVVPDVIVRKVKGKWITAINPAVLPRICVNRRYAELFRANRTSAHGQLATQLQEARWLVRSSEQRFTTILRVAESIVAKQKAYLEHGELAMRPLGLRHIAEELGLHESTVSRVTSNKYMATPRGLVDFRRFFSRELKTDAGGACSATAIRALIKEMIGTETRGQPLSDARLAQMLGGQGIQVARRTITKYRRQLQLPSVEMRRQDA
jgi:RNA polymerase sigma-54 factor